MSRIKIRAALEAAIKAMTPTIPTAWENTAMKPPVGSPYQKITLAFAEPRNTEFGPVFQERGYMQVALVYPGGMGSPDAEARVQMLRDRFPRGATLTADGQVVTINLTSNVLPGFNDDSGNYVLTVRIPFFAQVSN